MYLRKAARRKTINKTMCGCGVAIVMTLTCFGAVRAQVLQQVKHDTRVDELLGKMTHKEKLSLIHGVAEDSAVYQGQAGYIAGVPGLGIPGMRFADGPPGLLTRIPAQAETATIGVAATFSRKDARENGIEIGRQARARGIDVALQPFVNIDRDLEFGRGYNTFGEDPFLTGEMGAEEIKGIQSQHVMSQVKHYIGYDSNSFNIYIDDQTLHEVYVAPFDVAIRAGVSSIMCSYNRINGSFACGNRSVLIKILREQLGFHGFVTSDWGATHAVSFINEGLDMEMPGERDPKVPTLGRSYFDCLPEPPESVNTPAKNTLLLSGRIPEEKGVRDVNIPWDRTVLDPKKMLAALKDGSVTEAAITQAARRVLMEMERFGFLDGMTKHAVTPVDEEANARIIEKTSEDAAVLLKNEEHILPLKKADLSSLVLIGPTAGQVDAIGIGGERSTGLPQRQVSPLTALKKISGADAITYAVADDMDGSTIPANLLSHDGQPGLLRHGSCGASPDATINFTLKAGNPLPANKGCTWNGELKIAREGEYWLYLQVLGSYAHLIIDGQEVAHTGSTDIHGVVVHAGLDNVMPTTDGLDNIRRAVRLSAGAHQIEIHTIPDSSNFPVQIRLNWYTAEDRKRDYDAAITAAKRAKIAIVFAWAQLLPVFGLPGEQDKLIEKIAAVNPNTIVVLNTSQPVALPWAHKVKAILQMWWPGDEGGWSTANILMGNVSPAGRLPVTWGKRLEDYPATDPKHPERSDKGVDGKTIFSEGVNVGYRWFDLQKTEPLYPFGYGLSYTTFTYSGLSTTKSPDGGLVVSFRVTNAGNVESDEVPQVYLGAPGAIPPGVQFALRTLVGFDRIHLKPGDRQNVVIHVAPRQLQYWSTRDNRWITANGKRVVSVGASSRDLRLEQSIAM
jgi:beta-glucosidase